MDARRPPRAEASGGATLSDLIASLVFLAIAAGAILWDHFVGFVYFADTGWVSFLAPELWPWWIGGLFVLMALEALLAISVYAKGRWDIGSATINLVLNLTVAGYALWLLSQQQLINPEFFPTVIPDDSRRDRVHDRHDPLRVRHRRDRRVGHRRRLPQGQRASADPDWSSHEGRDASLGIRPALGWTTCFSTPPSGSACSSSPSTSPTPTSAMRCAASKTSASTSSSTGITSSRSSGDPDGLHFESWTMLGAWAEQTERVEFGALVNCNSYRNPDLQADMARTIDHISAKGGDGRFIFGTGAGWFEKRLRRVRLRVRHAGHPPERPRRGPRPHPRPLGRAQPRADSQDPGHDRRQGRAEDPAPRRAVRRHTGTASSAPTSCRTSSSVIEKWAEREGRDTSNLILSNELQRRGQDVADELFDGGVRLFTLGFPGPDYDYDRVRSWLAWRDAKNG